MRSDGSAHGASRFGAAVESRGEAVRSLSGLSDLSPALQLELYLGIPMMPPIEYRALMNLEGEKCLFADS